MTVADEATPFHEQPAACRPRWRRPVRLPPLEPDLCQQAPLRLNRCKAHKEPDCFPPHTFLWPARLASILQPVVERAAAGPVAPFRAVHVAQRNFNSWKSLALSEGSARASAAHGCSAGGRRDVWQPRGMCCAGAAGRPPPPKRIAPVACSSAHCHGLVHPSRSPPGSHSPATGLQRAQGPAKKKLSRGAPQPDPLPWTPVLPAVTQAQRGSS